jgi:large conductance mechanosensitive channel
LKGFMEFIRKQGVVGLAIGFIVGVAVSGVVNSLVTDIINPFIGMIIGTNNLNRLTFTVGDAVFRYGSFIAVLINLVIILAVVYFGFKALRLEKLDLAEEEEEEEKAESPLDIAKRRYASGEISSEEFKRIKDGLEN